MIFQSVAYMHASTSSIPLPTSPLSPCPSQEASSFKLASLQQQLSETVPSSLLDRLNQDYADLSERHQRTLRQVTARAKTEHTVHDLRVSRRAGASRYTVTVFEMHVMCSVRQLQGRHPKWHIILF